MSLEEARVKLRNTQLNKLKSAAENRTGATLRITNQNFQDKEFPYKLYLTTDKTKKTKINVPANNMSPDTKFSKAQISKVIQSGESFGSWSGNLGKKALTHVAIPFAKDDIPGLVSNITLNAIN